MARVITGAFAPQSGHAVGSSSGPTTVSASYADLTDMSVTLTTRGGVLLAWFSGQFSHSAAGSSVTAALSLDAAAEVAPVAFSEPTIGFAAALTTCFRFTGVSAGSHTVKVRWLTSGATATASGTSRVLTVQEVAA
jgi:hypothetical protein